MFSTGLYKDEYNAWNHLVPLSRTLSTFKIIYTVASRKLREIQALTGNTGYIKNVQYDLMEQTALELSTQV